MKTYIAPSILSANFGRLAEEVRAVEKGGADMIHVDVMDGHFVPPITIGAAVVSDLKQATNLPLDVHLMVENPENHIETFAQAGAANITVHAEACRHLDRVVRLIKSRNIKAGVAVNPATPLSSIFYVLPLLDLVLIMSVNPGYGGQRFLDYTLGKIEAVKAEIEQRKQRCVVQVDGGITVDNVAQVVQAGADIVVAGSAIFHSPDYARTIARMRTLAEEAS